MLNILNKYWNVFNGKRKHQTIPVECLLYEYLYVKKFWELLMMQNNFHLSLFFDYAIFKCLMDLLCWCVTIKSAKLKLDHQQNVFFGLFFIKKNKI